MNTDTQNPVREEKTRKRFRPTFSLRTMLVAITVVTAYFVCWEATRENGMESGKARICPVPFLVIEYGAPNFGVIGNQNEPFGFKQEQKYFLCFFGEPQLITQRISQSRLDPGLTHTQRRQKLKEIAKGYGKLIRRGGSAG